MAARKLSCSASQQRSQVSRSAGFISSVLFLGEHEHVGGMCARRRRGLARGRAAAPGRYSRNVSSMTKRGSRRPSTRWTSRLLSTSAATPCRTSTPRSSQRIADGLGRLERAAAGEDREPAEEPLLGRRQQVVAPLDRAAAGSAAAPAGPARRRSGARAGRSIRASSSRGRQDLHPRGGELDRERQAIEPAADVDHRAGVLRRSA